MQLKRKVCTGRNSEEKESGLMGPKLVMGSLLEEEGLNRLVRLELEKMSQLLVLRGSGQCKDAEVGVSKMFMFRDKQAERSYPL